MIHSSHFKNIFARFQRQAVFAVVALLCGVSATAICAQETGQLSQTNALSASRSPTPAVGVPKPKSRSDIANDYKSSLDSLSVLYQNEVKRLAQQNNQSKELYDQGLISRNELENSNQALANAQAKVEEVAKQIAAANQPTLPDTNPNSDLASHSWTTGSTRLDSLINYYSNQYHLDPYLVYCLMSQESKFGAGATSPKGAQGLMQLMPGTAARYGVADPYDVAQNIRGGARYLKDLLTMFNGRIDLALAGYNAGENAVIKYGYTIPPYEETRNYVKLIIARYGRKKTT